MTVASASAVTITLVLVGILWALFLMQRKKRDSVSLSILVQNKMK